jgi:hypothetical protein
VLSRPSDSGEFPRDVSFLIKFSELRGRLFAPFSEETEPVVVTPGAFSDISFGCEILARSNAASIAFLTSARGFTSFAMFSSL